MRNIKLINFIDLSLEEKKMILEWRNSPNIKKYMYTQNEISLENHLKFIDSLKNREDNLYFLVKKDDDFIGVIDFINITKYEADFGFYANPSSKIVGIGRILENVSIDFAFNTLKVEKLKLEVFEDNIQVRNLHKKYKFKETGKKFVNGKKVICMELDCNLNKEKTVLTYGTFDMFHIGHLKLLQRLKALGNRLVVAVSTDEFNELKGKKTLIPFEQRALIVENIKCVDMVIAEKNWEQKIEDIKKYNIDIFAMGDDWQGKFDFLKEYCEVVYLPRTQNISTTELKKELNKYLGISDE